jgi:hypothetical protein
MEAQGGAPTLDEPAAASPEPKAPSPAAAASPEPKAPSPEPKAPSPTETKPLMAEEGHGSPAASPEGTAEDKSDAHKKMLAFEEQKRKAESVDMVSHFGSRRVEKRRTLPRTPRAGERRFCGSSLSLSLSLSHFNVVECVLTVVCVCPRARTHPHPQQHSEDEDGIEIIERESPPGGHSYLDLIPPLKRRNQGGWK